ncbi:hypothetical protein HPB47_016995 [Ixodes persulcatus]|uniref:Uncharacterized protein n=1 Tax=Ixodes persulcatus TaxID=34615 RepID=A0AC60QPG2_IXOPE|nr:hypothetical protein HPB47_016995 [Ixodes persulcatus]
MEDGQVVETKQGQLKGRTQTVSGKTVQVYLGIPYAEPPINHLRFRKPTPSKSWSGTYDATQKKLSCPQEFYPSLADIGTDLSEDCLYLNVWTPSTVRPTRPVVVWIHGGAFAFGSSYENSFNGSLLAVMHDLVVVTINYRLGILGFLGAGVPDAPGNVGLLDQRLALQWVRENVHVFGGNPTRVTISAKTPCLKVQTEEARWPRDSIARHRSLHLSSHPDIVLECLRSKPTDALSDAVKNVTDPTIASFVPTYPNEFFPVRPVLALKQGRFADVDAMVSVTSSEGTVMVISQPDKRFWDEDLGNVSVEELKPALREMLVTAMGDKYIDLVEYYAAQAAQDNKQELREMYTEFLGDSYFVCPMKYFSQKHSGKGNSVYSFVFGHRSVKSTLPEWSGVPHLADVPYYFGVPLWDYESYSDEDRNRIRPAFAAGAKRWAENAAASRLGPGPISAAERGVSLTGSDILARRDAAYVMSRRSSGSSNAREREPRRELSRLLVIFDEMLRELLPQPAPPPLLEGNRCKRNPLVAAAAGSGSAPAAADFFSDVNRWFLADPEQDARTEASKRLSSNEGRSNYHVVLHTGRRGTRVRIKAELHGTNLLRITDEFWPAAFALRVESTQWLLRRAQIERALRFFGPNCTHTMVAAVNFEDGKMQFSDRRAPRKNRTEEKTAAESTMAKMAGGTSIAVCDRTSRMLNALFGAGGSGTVLGVVEARRPEQSMEA